MLSIKLEIGVNSLKYQEHNTGNICFIQGTENKDELNISDIREFTRHLQMKDIILKTKSSRLQEKEWRIPSTY